MEDFFDEPLAAMQPSKYWKKFNLPLRQRIWNVLSGNLLQFAVEAIPVEIVDFPINSMVDLSIAM